MDRHKIDVLDLTPVVNIVDILFLSHTDGYFHTVPIHHLQLNPINLIGRFCFPLVPVNVVLLEIL